ncbi:MAG TPA: EscT/YscT/HrcT family type III secretion system export apparatus protein [Waddliaceae bacterium]
MEVTPSDTYLSFVLSQPLSEIWKIFLLGMARIVPTMAIAPFLGGKMLPDTIKMGFGIAIVFIFLPFLVVHYTQPIQFDLIFMLLLFKEAIVGSILGFLITIPFYYTQGAGALIDHQRGSQSLQVMDPSTQMQTSPTGTLFNNMMLVIFFFIGGPILFFDALFTSYSVLPFDQFFSAEFFAPHHPLWISLIQMTNTVVKIALQLSAPSLIAMLLSDLFLGIANRMAPQVQISFLLWSLKAFVGIAMVWVGWWVILKQFDIEGVSWIKLFTRIVEQL